MDIKTTIGADGRRYASLCDLHTPRLNDDIYGKITPADVAELAGNIRRHGVLDPLTVNREGAIISGNRRAFAASMAGLERVPVNVVDIPEETPAFEKLLVSANLDTREKSLAQVAHERAVMTDPAEAEAWMYAKRIEADARTRAAALDGVRSRRRKGFVETRAFADAVKRVVLSAETRPTLRQVHYMLLNDPPVVNTKTGRVYRNDESSYKTLSDIATRLRMAGELDTGALRDATRPLANVGIFSKSSRDYVRSRAESFGRDYRRDLMQSQECYICAFVEKQTQEALFSKFLLDEFPGVPLAVLRGFSSVSAVHVIVEAWRDSGKRKLVLVGMTDCDPCGEEIVFSLTRTLGEMGLAQGAEVDVVRAGLTMEQAKAEGARPAPVKASDRGGGVAKADAYAKRHGGCRDVYELESIAPARLLDIMRGALTSVLDVGAFNRERKDERREMPELLALNRTMLEQVWGYGE